MSTNQTRLRLLLHGAGGDRAYDLFMALEDHRPFPAARINLVYPKKAR